MFLVTATPPTPNGPLHLGHISGPYLRADIAARALRASGNDVAAVCGIDLHQNYVLAGAGSPDHARRFAKTNSDRIRSAWNWFGIEYDQIIDPATQPAYVEFVRRAYADLKDTPLFSRRQMLGFVSDSGNDLHHATLRGACGFCGAGANGGTCEGCGQYLWGVDVRVDGLVDNESANSVSQDVGVLRLDLFREAARSVWLRTATSAGRTVAWSYEKSGTGNYVSEYTTNWGIELAEGFRLDVWVEMALSYLYAVSSRHGVHEWDIKFVREKWSQLDGIYQFLGFDNAFYNLILFPSIYSTLGLDLEKILYIDVNQFLNLDGQKFSTSRRHAIWADEIDDEFDYRCVREFLAVNSPESRGSNFTLEALQEFASSWSPPMDTMGFSQHAADGLVPPRYDLQQTACKAWANSEAVEQQWHRRLVTGG